MCTLVSPSRKVVVCRVRLLLSHALYAMTGTGTFICAAYMYKKPIVALKNSGGTASKYSDRYLDHRKNVKIVGVDTPQQAIKYILEQINT